MKKLAIVAIVLVVCVAIAAGVGVYYLTGTPLYSLYLVRNAVLDGDSATFYEHFDVGLVAQNATKRMIADLPAPIREYVSRALDFAGPAIETAIRKKIDEKLKATDKSFMQGKSVESVRYQDEMALVSVKNDVDGTTTTITLVQMPSRHWKIVDLDLGKNGISIDLPGVPSTTPPALPDGQLPAFPRLPRRQ
jgi:hypothetical protein